jgi:hypothetical protein
MTEEERSATDDARAKAEGRRTPPEPMPWDRLGMLLGDLALAGKNMADRNLELWSSVSQNLRDERGYTADRLTDDAARAMATAMINAQEAWESMVRPPERELVAFALPTVLLVFTPRPVDKDKQRYDPVEPVWMRVRGADPKCLPKCAEIALTGDPLGVEQLRGRLSTILGESRQAYLLQTSNLDDELTAGAYDGTVYVMDPSVRPIALLRVIVKERLE